MSGEVDPTAIKKYLLFPKCQKVKRATHGEISRASLFALSRSDKAIGLSKYIYIALKIVIIMATK